MSQSPIDFPNEKELACDKAISVVTKYSKITGAKFEDKIHTAMVP